MNPFVFEGRVAVVTGAASGIGTGLVREALRRGMRVVAADVQAERLREFVATLQGDVLAVPTDVTDADSVEALARRAWQHYGGVDLLFNNAGIMATGFSWQIEPARWRRSFEVNVHGIHNGLRAFVPRMLAAGKPAHIVNTASVGGFLASPLMSPYSATKFAVVALTESLRGELEMTGAPIGVSLLAPGPVISGIFDDPFGAQPEPAAQQFVELMRGMLQQNGLTPDAFAQRVFDGVAQGQFWLIPQPEALDDAFRQKAADVLARRNPVLPKF
ncbi:MAG TPA: SDR family NAD(P)-dependent oxidoreductase [Solimonas sp.]|nr:SDR family NAD(P)-dependent oxidoreductase [Solimonas sp.]